MAWTEGQTHRNDSASGNSQSSRYEGKHWCRSRVGAWPMKCPRAPRRMSRTLSLQVTAKEYVWLRDHRYGVATKAIASREGVSVRRVRFGLARVLAELKAEPILRPLRPPRLVPLFPIGPYTPQSSCAHRRPIRAGSLLCCMVCHRSGMDEHPALQRNFGSESIQLAVSVQGTLHETRRQRRRRIFGSEAQRGKVTTQRPSN